MINFYIPGFFLNFQLNYNFLTYFFENREQFYDNINIGGIYDSFPGCEWNGGRIKLESYSLPTQSNIINTIKYFNQLNIPCCFTFSNNLINKEDLDDVIGNFILKIAYNNINQIILSNDLLKEKIKKEYPNYKLISSTTKILNNINLLENELKNEDYYLVVPDISLNNTDELFNISQPQKCEILLNDTCFGKCPYRKDHYIHIDKTIKKQNVEKYICQYQTLKRKNFYELLESNPSHITKEKLYGTYIEKGFNNFKIVGGRECNDFEILEFYLYYMAKPEFINTIRYNILREFN